MTRHHGGTKVPGGYYWSPRQWTLTPVPDEGGVLPGGAGDRYLRISWVTALLLAPVLGGLFVVFLPFLGFGMLLHWAWQKATGRAREGARDLAATLAPGWRPGEAHLTGRAPEPPPAELPASGAGEEALHDVEQEIARRRDASRNGKGD